jgi:hypothetical protein
MSVTGGALYVSKLTTNNSKLACIAIWLYSCPTIWVASWNFTRPFTLFYTKMSFQNPQILMDTLEIT